MNPNGIPSFSPGLTRIAGLPWVTVPQISSTLKRVESIPDIPFVEFDFVTTQQWPELILKRNLALMFLLRGDVIPHGFNL